METRTDYAENVAHSNDIKVKRIYWGAIFAGAVVMLVTMMLLNLLGLGIGLGSINPATESQPFQGLGVGALIWWIISNIIAIFAGAFVAGRMAGIPHKQSGMLHGIVAWCVFTFVVIWIYTTAIGTVVSGVGSAVSGTFSGVGDVVKSVGQSDVIEEVRKEVNYALQESGVADTVKEVQISRSEFRSIVQRLFIKDGEVSTQVSREEVVSAISQETNLSRAQVERVADELEKQSEKLKQRWQEVKQKAEEKGQDVASAASSAAIWAFIGLLIGAITAGIAGGLGRPEHFLHEELRRIP